MGRWRAGGRTFNQAALYVVAIGGAAAAAGIVLPRGDQLVAAPAAPAYGAVAGGGEECLGSSIVFDQSGIHLGLRAGSSGDAGPLVASGRIDRHTGRGVLDGRCAPGSDRAGEQAEVSVRVHRDDRTVDGTVRVGGEVAAFSIDGDVSVEAVSADDDAEPLAGGELATRVLLAVIVVILTARVVGSLVSRLRQPRVVGEILAGIMLGPSLLGVVSPETVSHLFAPEVTAVLRVMAQFGLILFMFLIGLELDHRLVRQSAHSAVLISHASIALPFALGMFLAWWLYPTLGGGRFSAFALFIGTAMAITAFPVLARILTDTGLDRSRIGSITLACAAVDDVTAWCLLAAVVGIASAAGAADALEVAGLSVVYIAVMLWVVRPVATRLISVHEARGRSGQTAIAALLVTLLLSAWTTEKIGIHAIFGAFIAGAVLPRPSVLLQDVSQRLEDLTVLFLLPIFFAVVGLSTRFGLVDRPDLWAIVVVVVAVAVAGKWGGSMIAARLTGSGWRASAAIGILMNTRGLTEIIILTIGRDLGILSPALFTIMVIMALTTTLMATPLLSVVYPRHLVEREAARASAAMRLGQGRAQGQRVLVGVGNPATAGPLVELVAGLRTVRDEAPTVMLAHFEPRRGREEVRANLRRFDASTSAAEAELEPLANALRGDGIEVLVTATSADDLGAELARMAMSTTASLVVVGQHHSYFGYNPLGGAVADLLRTARCDVAVVLDAPLGPGDTSGPVAVVHEVEERDRAALDLAIALARGRGVGLLILEPSERADRPTATPLRRDPGVDVERLSLRSDLDVGRALQRASVIVLGHADGDVASFASQLVGAAAVVVVDGTRLRQGSSDGSARAGRPVATVARSVTAGRAATRS